MTDRTDLTEANDVEKPESKQTRLQRFVMRLFRDQALTISKSGDEVRIGCDSADDACEVFEWLAMMTGNSVSFDGRASGDMECFCWDNVPDQQRNEIDDDPWHEVSGRLYPGDVLRALSAEDGQHSVSVMAWRLDA